MEQKIGLHLRSFLPRPIWIILIYPFTWPFPCYAPREPRLLSEQIQSHKCIGEIEHHIIAEFQQTFNFFLPFLPFILLIHQPHDAWSHAHVVSSSKNLRYATNTQARRKPTAHHQLDPKSTTWYPTSWQYSRNFQKPGALQIIAPTTSQLSHLNTS